MKSEKTSDVLKNEKQQERLFGFSFAVRTDVGMRRDENQDAYGLAQTKDVSLFIVTDGMGGASGGARASFAAANLLARLAIDSSGRITPKSFHNSITQANKFIYNESQTDENLAGMGTTLVMVGVVGDRALIANVGDSRIYLKRDRSISRLTKDHTLVQQLVELGEISADQAESHPMAHMLTRSLGPMDHIEADIGYVDFKLQEDDTFILCCDGLYNHVADFEIAEIVHNCSPGEAAEELVRLANSRGGSDNITVEIVNLTNIQDTPKSCAFPTKESRIEIATSGESKKFISPEHKHLFKEVVVKVHDKFTSKVDSSSSSVKQKPSSLDLIKGTETKPSVMTDGTNAFDSIILGQIPKETKDSLEQTQSLTLTAESDFNVLQEIPVSNFSEESLISQESFGLKDDASKNIISKEAKSEIKSLEGSHNEVKEVKSENKVLDESKEEKSLEKSKLSNLEPQTELLNLKEKTQTPQKNQLKPLDTKSENLGHAIEKNSKAKDKSLTKISPPKPADLSALHTSKLAKDKPILDTSEGLSENEPLDLQVKDISYLEEYSESFPPESSSKSLLIPSMFGAMIVLLGLGGGWYFLKENPAVTSKLDSVKSSDWFTSFNGSENSEISQQDRVVTNEQIRTEVKKTSSSASVKENSFIEVKNVPIESPKISAQLPKINNSVETKKLIKPALKVKTQENSLVTKGKLSSSDFSLASKMDKDDPLLQILKSKEKVDQEIKIKNEVLDRDAKSNIDVKSSVVVPEVNPKEKIKVEKESKIVSKIVTSPSNSFEAPSKPRKIFLKKSRIRDKIDEIDGKLHSYKAVSMEDLKKKQDSIEEQIPIINESLKDTRKRLNLSKREYATFIEKKSELKKGNISKIARDASQSNPEIKKFSQDWQEVSLKYRNASEKNMKDSSYSAQMAELGKEIKVKKDRLKKSLTVFMDLKIKELVRDISDDGLMLQNLEKRKKLLARQVNIARKAEEISPQKRAAEEKRLLSQRASLMKELTILNKKLSDEAEESLKRKKILSSHGVN